jgi:hypothetical protein
MANEKVISGNLRMTLDDKTVFHSTECSLTVTREIRERSTKDTDGIERAKGQKSFSGSASSLAVYKGDGEGTHDFGALFDLYDDDDDVAIPIEFVPSEGDATFMFKGECIIESLELNLAVEEDGTASISFSGSKTLKKVALPL